MSKEKEFYGINEAVEVINKLNFDQIDILNEYLNNEKMAIKYLAPCEEYKNPETEKTFFPVIAGFLNSNHWGKESIKHYALYKSREFLSKQ